MDFLRTAPYDGLARVRVKMNRPIEAFKDSEYTKARIFAETMSKWSEATGFDIPADILTGGSGTQRSACSPQEKATRGV